MKKLMLFAVLFLFAAAGAYAQQPSTGAADAGVPVEEYVPKVIIEGKWGTGPGEFGRQSDVDYDLKPESLAVDSKGNIYVLDFVNNRIQKYSNEGKHLKDIPVDGLRGPVECWSVKEYDEVEKQYVRSVNASAVKPEGVPDSDLQPYIWPPEVQGINIVIDSKDDLYYYLKRVKDGKESGEVWQFRNDKVVKKMPFESKRELPAKFGFAPVSHNQEELIVSGETGVTAPGKYEIEIKKSGEVSIVSVRDRAKKTSREIEVGPTEAYLAARARVARAKNDVHLEKILDNGNIRLRVVSGSVDALATEEREYTPEGKLVRRIKSPPGYSHGLNVDGEGVKIVRWEVRQAGR